MTAATHKLRRFGRAYAVAAGVMDTATGLTLVLAPWTVLALLQIQVSRVDGVWLRFIGSFVTGVGLLYLLPFLARDRRRVDQRLVAALESTTVARGCVGIFVGGAVALEALPPAWISVALTDLALAAAQIWLLRAGVFDDPS